MRNSGANRNCDDHCTVGVVILFAPEGCFQQSHFLMPPAFQEAPCSHRPCSPCMPSGTPDRPRRRASERLAFGRAGCNTCEDRFCKNAKSDYDDHRTVVVVIAFAFLRRATSCSATVSTGSWLSKLDIGSSDREGFGNERRKLESVKFQNVLFSLRSNEHGLHKIVERAEPTTLPHLGPCVRIIQPI